MTNEDLPSFREPEKIVDDSWKEAVRKEKEGLAAHAPAPDKASQTPHPEASPLSEMVMSIYAQALVNFGAEPGADGRRLIKMEAGVQGLMILQILKEKTKGNLTEAEQQVLDSAFADVEVCHRNAVKYVATLRQQQQQGADK
jgi:hypothetical protein